MRLSPFTLLVGTKVLIVLATSCICTPIQYGEHQPQTDLKQTRRALFDLADLDISEEIDELKVVMNFVQYLRSNEVKDTDGTLLASKYFIVENGSSYLGELSQEGAEGGANLDKLRALLRKEESTKGHLDANKLRLNSANGDFSHLWRVIGADMILAIDSRTLLDAQDAHQFRQQFIDQILGPLRELIHDHYNYMLSSDHQGAKHQALMNALKDSFVLVRERLIEKLNGVPTNKNDGQQVGANSHHQLPELTQWDVTDQWYTDYLKYEFRALESYRELRRMVLGELDTDEREIILDALPQIIDHGFSSDLYGEFEVDKRGPPTWLCKDCGGREIDEKCLIDMKAVGPFYDESGHDLSGNEMAPKRRRLIWRTIYKAAKSLSLHVLAKRMGPTQNKTTNQQMFERVYVMLNNFKEAVLERANALNGMVDGDIGPEMLADFYSHRDNLNELFDRLGDEISSEKRPTYEKLMNRLKLTRLFAARPEEVVRFRVVAERESLWTSAKQHFLSALDHIRETSTTLIEASENLARVFAEVANDFEDDQERKQLELAFRKLSAPLGEYLKFSCKWTTSGIYEIDDVTTIRDVFMAQYQSLEPEVAKEFQVTLERSKTEETRAAIEKELKGRAKRLLEAIHSLSQFKTYCASYATRTGDERSLELMSAVLEGARTTLGQLESVDGCWISTGALSTNWLESQLVIRRVKESIKARGQWSHRRNPFAHPSRSISTQLFNDCTKLQPQGTSSSPI